MVLRLRFHYKRKNNNTIPFVRITVRLLAAKTSTAILREFWSFLRVRKKWWLASIVILLVTLGLILFLTEGSALAPFIYSLF
jgi:hypothetical protein